MTEKPKRRIILVKAAQDSVPVNCSADHRFDGLYYDDLKEPEEVEFSGDLTEVAHLIKKEGSAVVVLHCSAPHLLAGSVDVAKILLKTTKVKVVVLANSARHSLRKPLEPYFNVEFLEVFRGRKGLNFDSLPGVVHEDQIWEQITKQGRIAQARVDAKKPSLRNVSKKRKKRPLRSAK